MGLMKLHEPRLTVLVGPTAVGKGTVVHALLSRHPEIALSVSATTRAPRPGEINGTHYFFVSDDEFDRLVNDGQMLEWALVHGAHRYGTPRKPVEQWLSEGKSVLLEIDVAGARQVRASMPQAHFIFLAPPSWDELKRRLTERGTETLEEQERRLTTARAELDAAHEFDAIVINDDLDQAVTDLAVLMGLE